MNQEKIKIGDLLITRFSPAGLRTDRRLERDEPSLPAVSSHPLNAGGGRRLPILFVHGILAGAWIRNNYPGFFSTRPCLL